MDNLTHSLCGWLIARVGFERYGRMATPFLIVAANLPDLEPVLLPGTSRVEYLAYHRGVTHGVLLLAVNSLLLGVMLWFLELQRFKRKERETCPRIIPAFGICALGLFSHLGLDFLNSYGVRPWLPFDGRWYYGDMVFIVDPWLWLLLGVPIFLGGPKTRGHAALWLVLAVIGSALIVWGTQGELVPLAVPVLWFFTVAAAIALRFFQREAAQPGRCARTGLLAACGYVLLLFAASRTATDRALAAFQKVAPAVPIATLKASVLPNPARPWLFDVLLQDGETLYHVQVNVFVEPIITKEKVALNLSDPALKAVRQRFEYAAWRAFARHPFVERAGDMLILGDMRYRATGRGDWTAQRLLVPRE